MNKVLLLDGDSTIPNLALMKLSTYHKNIGDKIIFKRLNIPYYPSRKKKEIFIETKEFKKVYCSLIFEGGKEYIKGENIIFGGTGVDLTTNLSEEVENLPPDYFLYPENDISYGFISRGCIRNCSFCKVPTKEGYIRQVNTIDNIVKHKKVKFLDNNILALPNHLDILEELKEKKIHCQFNQGLDIRLLTEESSFLLSQLKYLGEYIFAFDNWKEKKVIENKLNLLFWRKNWQLKFFVYIHPSMPLGDTINRIEWLKERKCLPYIMRDITCWESGYKDFYTDIAAYCNQVNLFKKLSFFNFLKKRTNNQERIEKSYSLYKGA